MLKDFNQFKFNVIDITPKGSSDILVTSKGITISKGSIEELGYPPYVRMMIDSENCVFAIQVCKQTDENAYKFAKSKEEQKKPVYCHTSSVKKIIRELMPEGCLEDGSYRIKGTYYKEAKAVVFNLKTATLRKGRNGN